MKAGGKHWVAGDATLIDLVLSGTLDPVMILTYVEPVQNVIQADRIKVALHPMSQAAE